MSAWNGDRPAPIRRMTASEKSRKGITITPMGSRIGRNCPKKSAPESLPGSTWPVTAMVPAASSSPSSIEPESPMKILALVRLCGRKPTQAPIITAVSSAASEE